jgi:hypothetical protein
MKGEPMRKLTREQKRDIRAIAAKRDDDIDFSEVPPVLDWSGAEIGKFYRPKKKPVTWLLRNAMLHLTKEARISRRKVAARGRKAREGKGKG